MRRIITLSLCFAFFTTCFGTVYAWRDQDLEAKREHAERMRNKAYVKDMNKKIALERAIKAKKIAAAKAAIAACKRLKLQGKEPKACVKTKTSFFLVRWWRSFQKHLTEVNRSRAERDFKTPGVPSGPKY